MATSSCQVSEVQFLCSICLDVFTDPVSVPCGHTFCKKCINKYWPPGAKCICPYRKNSFFPRPELQVNIFVAEMTTQFRRSQSEDRRSSEEQALTDEVLCDVCTGPKQHALKSCLVCLSSYCESHLEPHLNMSGLRRHQLTKPLRDLEKRVCAEHDKPLELFCVSDQLCVCVLCLHSKHKNHQVLPLKEASDQHRLQLQNTEAHIQDKINGRMKKIDELRDTVRDSNAAAEHKISDGVKVFTPLMETVESGLDLLISELTKKKTDTEQQAESLIQELEQEINKLEKSRAEVKLLSQSDDPLHLLLTSSQLSPEPPTKDWTHIHVSAPVYEGTVGRALSELEQQLNQKIRGLCEEELKKDKTMEAASPTPNAQQQSTLGIHTLNKKGKSQSKRGMEDFRMSKNVQNTKGWDPDTGFDLNTLDPALKDLFDMCGISETDLKDPETSEVINDFIKTKGGVEAVKRELRRSAPPRLRPSAGGPTPPQQQDCRTAPPAPRSLFTFLYRPRPVRSGPPQPPSRVRKAPPPPPPSL